MELYFRSLKSIEVLTVFTKYLVQFGKVCIPGVGTFELVCHSPQLDVADHIFRPPYYITKYNPHHMLTEHQSQFFASTCNTQGNDTTSEMILFGEKLKSKMAVEPFEWTGFGTLRLMSNEIYFEPYQINLVSLNTIPARKVMRENARHSMLVGDQQMTSEQVIEVLNKPGSSRNWYMIIGWIMLSLAVLAIILHLLLDGFHPYSSGLRW